MSRSLYLTPPAGVGLGGAVEDEVLFTPTRKGFRNQVVTPAPIPLAPVAITGNQALSFPGTTEHTIVGNNPTVFTQAAPTSMFESSWTMAAWFNSSKMLGNTPMIMGFTDGQAGSDVYLQINSTNRLRGGVRPPGTSEFNEIKDTNLMIMNGTWYFGALVYTGSVETFRLYLNGIEQVTIDSESASPATFSERASVGGYHTAQANQRFQGTIMYPAVWNVALSASALMALFTATGHDPRTNTGGYTQSSNLVWLEAPLSQVQGGGDIKSMTNIFPSSRSFSFIAGIA